jgi:hypothetical protein
MRDGYDSAANAAVTFLPGIAPEAADAAGGPESLPAVRIGDVLVFVYAKDGVLRVSVDLDDSNPEKSPFYRYGVREDLVPMRICVQGETVFEASG